MEYSDSNHVCCPYGIILSETIYISPEDWKINTGTFFIYSLILLFLSSFVKVGFMNG
jgi:hypothetical protein